MSKKEICPPRWAQRFLAWYCKSSLLEDLEGDLQEYFDRNLKSKGAARARLIYIIDVFKFFRSYTVRKPKFVDLLIQWIMLSSYIKTSGRNILRNRLFSFINIAGLAISMSVGFVMIAVLMDLFAYDKFHEHHGNIYRVISRYEFLGRKDNEFSATTSLKAARAIKETFTGIEDVAIFSHRFSGDVSSAGKTIPLTGYNANESVLNVFSFKLLNGNVATALKNPFSALLTEQSALKLFGSTDVVGKIISINKEREYTITGIVQDPPKFSYIKFDMLVSLSTRTITEKNNEDDNRWDYSWSTWTYVLLKNPSDRDRLQANLNKLSVKEDKTVPNTHIELALQPMDEIVGGENYSNQMGPVLGKSVVYNFLALTFIVILSACFNYTNLSVARSFRRSKEVGIRKAIGALKSHVTMQFIVESVMISLIAVVIALGIFILVRPHFLSMENSLQRLLVLQLTPSLIGLFMLFAVFVGVVAGIFPALFFSRINTVQTLKNLSAVPVLKGVTMRKVLIVFQYCISIIFITATLIIHKQYKHFLAYDLGYSTQNILNIRLQGNKASQLKNELSQLPEVKSISQSILITSIGNYWGVQMKNPNDPKDSSGVYYNIIDENYLPLHDHKLIVGRNFVAKSDSSIENEVIVNREVLKRFNLSPDDPLKAIGQVINIDGKDMSVIGVLQDFEYGRANNRTGKEVVFRYAPTNAEFLNVKILSEDWPATYAKIESIWKKIDDVHPLEAKFYNEQIEESFSGLSAAIKLGGFLAFLVIGISSIGLLGMVVFTTETKLKEVSIRKVLGATEAGLIYLLGRGFFVLIGIAACISLPITYLFFDQILLPELANHAPLEMFEMFSGFFAVTFIAAVMIWSQTLKVARTNPAEVLKTE
jgi:putative ABC transport system permease protein